MDQLCSLCTPNTTHTTWAGTHTTTNTMHEPSGDDTPDDTPGSFDSPETKSNREIHQHLKAIRNLVLQQDQPSEDSEELKQSFSEYLRQEVDKLRVGASIAQNRLDLLTKASRMMLITVAGIGIVTQLYQLVADAALLTNQTEQHSTTLAVVVPPAVLNALSTLLVIVLKQLGVVERASELAVVKRDADVVVAKMTSLEHLVSNASTKAELDELHVTYGGELTTLKTDVSSKLNTHLRQEDQAKLAGTYRRIMLSDFADTVHFERIRKKIVDTSQDDVASARREIEVEIQAFGQSESKTHGPTCCECLAAL